jgi:hypothetical protein
MQPQVADVLKAWKRIETIGLNTWQLRTLSAIKRCRTAELGGHIDACDEWKPHHKLQFLSQSALP